MTTTFITYELDDHPDESAPYVKLHYCVWYTVNCGQVEIDCIGLDHLVVWIGKHGEEVLTLDKAFEDEAIRRFHQYADMDDVLARCRADHEQNVEAMREQLAEWRMGA